MDKVVETSGAYGSREALWGKGRYDDIAKLFHSCVPYVN